RHGRRPQKPAQRLPAAGLRHVPADVVAAVTQRPPIKELFAWFADQTPQTTPRSAGEGGRGEGGAGGGNRGGGGEGGEEKGGHGEVNGRAGSARIPGPSRSRCCSRRRRP